MEPLDADISYHGAEYGSFKHSRRVLRFHGRDAMARATAFSELHDAFSDWIASYPEVSALVSSLDLIEVGIDFAVQGTVLSALSLSRLASLDPDNEFNLGVPSLDRMRDAVRGALLKSQSSPSLHEQVVRRVVVATLLDGHYRTAVNDDIRTFLVVEPAVSHLDLADWLIAGGPSLRWVEAGTAHLEEVRSDDPAWSVEVAEITAACADWVASNPSLSALVSIGGEGAWKSGSEDVLSTRPSLAEVVAGDDEGVGLSVLLPGFEELGDAVRRDQDRFLGEESSDRQLVVRRVLRASLLDAAAGTVVLDDLQSLVVVEPAISALDLQTWRDTAGEPETWKGQRWSWGDIMSDDLPVVPLHGGGLTISHRPKRTLVAELPSLGYTTVVTVLGEREGANKIIELVEAAGMESIWIPLDNANPPEDSDVIAMILERFETIRDRLENGAQIYLHCSAGIHRTGMLSYAFVRWLGLSERHAMDTLCDLREVTRFGAGGHRLSWGDQLVEDGFVWGGKRKIDHEGRAR